MKRDRSLLPETFQFFKVPHHGPHTPKHKEPPAQEEEDPLGDSVALPLTLKNTVWNGERWCSMDFSPRMAEVSNGYQLLHEELQKSQKRLKNCRYEYKSIS